MTIINCIFFSCVGSTFLPVSIMFLNQNTNPLYRSNYYLQMIAFVIGCHKKLVIYLVVLIDFFSLFNSFLKSMTIPLILNFHFLYIFFDRIPELKIVPTSASSILHSKKGQPLSPMGTQPGMPRNMETQNWHKYAAQLPQMRGVMKLPTPR